MKVLIVEDDVISRKKITYFIEHMGYEPIIAVDGEEGYRLWKEHRPRIVITDWVMPKMSGVELCQKIRKSSVSQYTYLIIVTSKANSDDIVEGMNAGADDYISKPYIKQELEVRIKAGHRIVEVETRELVIMAISKLAEARDRDTGFHLERIRHYSRTLASYLGKSSEYSSVIDDAFIENIYFTSMLHDIGKIAIPDAILLKPGKLTKEEFEIMKKHPVIGYETLIETASNSMHASFLDMSAEIALYHHEKFNGTGYPYGITGKKIPISARIVALCDVYDALVNKRVYKEAFEHEFAKKIIVDGSAKHFDPSIVEAFLKCEKSFIEIRENFVD